MSESTHTDLVAAVEGARPAVGVVLSNPRFHNALNAHLDTLAAVLDAAEEMGHDGRRVRHRVLFPIVADALRRMGAL